MNATRRAHTVAIPRATWALPDVKPWAARCLAFVFCLVAALFLTALRLEITRLHYDLSEFHAQREVLSAEAARLEVEAAALAAPRRIEEQARRLGFIYPDQESIVVLDE